MKIYKQNEDLWTDWVRKELYFMDYEIMMNGNVRIGQRAPDFNAVTTMGNICLNDYKGKWVVLFSHPGDFTPVKS